MSTYTGVSNFQKTVHFLVHPVRMCVCNLFNGSDGKVVEQIPRLMSDAFFTLVVALAGKNVCYKVTAGLFVTYVAHTGYQLIGHHTRLAG